MLTITLFHIRAIKIVNHTDVFGQSTLSVSSVNLLPIVYYKLPLYKLVERYPARVTVLPGGHRLDDGQRLELLPDHFRLETEWLIGKRSSQAPDEVHAVLVLGRVGQRPQDFHAAGPIHRRRGAHTPSLRILPTRFRIVPLRGCTIIIFIITMIFLSATDSK